MIKNSQIKVIASNLMAKMNSELVCSCSDKGLTVTLFIPLS